MAQVPASRLPAYSYRNISTQTTTIVKAAPGTILGIWFNAGTSGAVVTIYDNATAASGTKIGTITLGAAVNTPFTAPTLQNIAFANGLTVVTATQNVDITVAYA